MDFTLVRTLMADVDGRQKLKITRISQIDLKHKTILEFYFRGLCVGVTPKFWNPQQFKVRKYLILILAAVYS